MPIIDFEEKISIRFKRSILKDIEGILKVNKDKYYNLSHFIRSATNKLLIEEKEALKRRVIERELNKPLYRRLRKLF